MGARIETICENEDSSFSVHVGLPFTEKEFQSFSPPHPDLHTDPTPGEEEGQLRLLHL